MPRRFSSELLFRLRNEIPIERLIAEHLGWPTKRRAGQFSFLCPRCGEFQTAANPRTNLSRCFRCAENFNPIDFVIVARDCDFVDAVQFLCGLLPGQASPASLHPPRGPSAHDVS